MLLQPQVDFTVIIMILSSRYKTNVYSPKLIHLGFKVRSSYFLVHFKEFSLIGLISFSV